ncbi:SCF ubiquitin ligase complex subunit cdc4, partial [Coemansia sp. RSA 2052]
MDATRLAPDMYPLAHVAVPPTLEQFAVEMDGQQLYFSQQHVDEEINGVVEDVPPPRAMTPLYTHDDARQQQQQQQQHQGASLLLRRSSSPPPVGLRRTGGRGSSPPPPQPPRKQQQQQRPATPQNTGGGAAASAELAEQLPLPTPLLSPQQALAQGGCGGLGAVYSLPALISTYDRLPGPVQAYLLFQLLRRTPRPTLQFAAQTVLPVLHRDFVGALPAEVAHH